MLEEKEFNEKYWFHNTDMITVVNPRTEDYAFQATIEIGIDNATGKPRTETRHYKVKAGESERFPGYIANMYLDQMSKLLAQDDEKIQFMIDFTLKADYYDKLIVSQEDLVSGFTPHPAYLDKPEEKASEDEEEGEEAFSEVKKETKPTAKEAVKSAKA